MRSDRVPRGPAPSEDPLDVAALLRARADADEIWAALVAGDDPTPAGHALRMYMRDRRAAWLTVARAIEVVADLHLAARLWRVVDECARRRALGGPKGPVYDTALELLSDVLDRLDARGDDDDPY